MYIFIHPVPEPHMNAKPIAAKHKLLISWTFLAIFVQAFSKPIISRDCWINAELTSISQVGHFNSLFVELPCLVLFVDLPFNNFEGCLVVLTQYVSNPLSETQQK